MSTVLFVDDDPDIRTLGRMALERVGGLEVVLAGSATEALEVAARARVDVVLLDVMMPGGGGPAVLGALRERTGAPVLFLTARVQERDLEEYREAGAAGVIPKPFDPMTLAAEVLRLARLPRRGAAP